MKALALILVLVGGAGCQFTVDGLPITGSDDGGDAGVPIDNGVPDEGADLPRFPDGFMPPDGLLPGQTGYPCSGAGQCANGLCVDGFCCDDLCDPALPANLCKACNVPGFEGHCVQVLANTDPRGQCPDDGAQSCGRDGLCGADGKCRLYGAGTACGAASCANGFQTYAPACDGKGTCRPPQPSVSCYPYACKDAFACNTSCTTDGQCAPGVSCQGNGSCGNRALGQPCAGNADCQSQVCAQGVCCDGDCAGTCVACNLPGSVGVCTAVPAGQDPLDQCTADSRSSCAQDGNCNGAGACALWATGTICAPPACMGDQVLSARSCDGNGTCQQARAQGCGAYSCNPSNASCYTSCTSSAQCAKGKMCNIHNGKCM